MIKSWNELGIVTMHAAFAHFSQTAKYLLSSITPTNNTNCPSCGIADLLCTSALSFLDCL